MAFDSNKLKENKKLIIRRVNKIIRHLQDAKKSAIAGRADIDNHMNAARIKLVTTQKYIRGEVW